MPNKENSRKGKKIYFSVINIITAKKILTEIKYIDNYISPEIKA
jgi:hypothetical protein